MAARLCGQAPAGEILATAEVVEKARFTPGVQHRRETIQVRGFDAPVSCIYIQPPNREPS